MEGGSIAKKKKIMVAIDENEDSRDALFWMFDFLKDTIVNSDVVVFTVQPPIDYTSIHVSTYGVAFPAGDLIYSLQENHRKTAMALLEKAKEICTKHGVEVETLTEVGKPKEVICEAVENLKIDLLIMGTHGRGIIQRAFLGSVSNYCVQNAKCPVLVVRK